MFTEKIFHAPMRMQTGQPAPNEVLRSEKSTEKNPQKKQRGQI